MKDLVKIVNESRLFKQALVHKIFRFEDFIIKVPKNNFPEFYDKDHFILEKNSLNLLRKSGIPTPEVLGIINECKRFNGRAVLIEKYIRGVQKTKFSMKEVEKHSLLEIMKKTHNIKVRGFGPLRENMCGSFKSWESFISNLISELSQFYLLHNIKRNDIKEIIKKIRFAQPTLVYKNTGRLLLTDINPGNIFFDGKGCIKAVIDVDHPDSGDPLFDVAYMKWHNPRIFKYFKIKNNLTLKKILIYEMLAALRSTMWRLKHNLSGRKDINRLLSLSKSYEKQF